MDFAEMEGELRRQLHETDDQFELRYKVYKQYVPKYGEDEAETLSMVFSNIKFMDCRYPPAVEAKLADCGALTNALAATTKSPEHYDELFQRALVAAKEPPKHKR